MTTSDDEDNASCGSEDSQKPHYHVETGKIHTAREAWSILAAEGHRRYSQSRFGGKNREEDAPVRSVAAAKGADRASSLPASDPPPLPPWLEDDDLDADGLQTASSLSGGPTQSSIDRALHPESPPNYISPHKDLPRLYQKKPSGQHSAHSYDGSMDGAPPPSDDEDEDVLRAEAMALAAQNGRRLTPAQLQLIARPDVQQQRLIEEAKRIQTAKESAARQAQKEQRLQGLTEAIALPQLPQLPQAEALQRMGADIKEFIKAEKEKPLLQRGSGLGKFIESQSRWSAAKGPAEPVVGELTAAAEGAAEEGGQGEGTGPPDEATAATAAAADAKTNPKSKRIMEGFGNPLSSPGRSPIATCDPATANAAVKWPKLPVLNEGLTSMLTGAGGGGGGGGGGRGGEGGTAGPELTEPVSISGILWKRRSGFGKHSTIKAWERRRVELRGSKLVYYRTQEEEEEEEGGDAAAPAAEGRKAHDRAGGGVAAPLGPGSGGTADEASNGRGEGDPAAGGTVPPHGHAADAAAAAPPPAEASLSKRPLGLFSQAAQAAEQGLEHARREVSRLAGAAAGRGAPADAPRGALDLLRDRVVAGVSAGHSGAPTPFCLSLKAGGVTRWKFGFETHGAQMEWLARLSDAVVGASVGAAGAGDGGGDAGGGGGGSWEMEEYCVRRRRGERPDETEGVQRAALSPRNAVAASGTSRPLLVAPAADSREGNETQQLMLAGMNLWIAWAAANLALVVARSSLTSIDQYWKLVVFTNFGIYQLCTRFPGGSSLLRFNEVGSSTTPETDVKRQNTSPSTLHTDSNNNLLGRKSPDYKPIAGSTTVQVTKVDDPRINGNGATVPSWIPISSGDSMNVRSHGYLTTRKKIPSPGTLYECVAVDCFVSDARFPEIAPRVHLPSAATLHREGGPDSTSGTQPWKSPDVFCVSVAIPIEAPRFGQSANDGLGMTITGYFRMKAETRDILRRITADPSATDPPAPESDLQKCTVNGVRLWERYCHEALQDPTFQARFKLIPLANLEELGCPSYIAKYSGKPVLIKRNQVTGFFTDYPSLNTMEFDISLHPFPYLFKQAMSYIKDYMDKTVVSFGFVIEGRSDDELPEVLIGAMTVCYPDPSTAVRGEEFFAGTCPKSTPS